MAHKSNIEWTEATWNPWHGCHKVSQGCKNCYMFRDKARYGQDPNVVVRSKTKFYDPVKWSEPRTIFTCSWSDFFIEEADPWRDEAFAIMALTPQHTYQVLTKRPDRMCEYLNNPDTIGRIQSHYPDIKKRTGPKIWHLFANDPWPKSNIWLGVSVEDQKTAEERIPLLLETPAALRWLSMEPLLGPVEVDGVLQCGSCLDRSVHWCVDPVIDWVVVGTESGPDRRPMADKWAADIVDQCRKATVPVFVKQIELDGKVVKEIAEFPDELRFREFPEVSR